MSSEHRNPVARAAKSGLRREARLRVAAMTRDERERADAAVCVELGRLVVELDPSFVLAYLALTDEVRLDDFLGRTFDVGVPVLVPRVVVAGTIGLASWRPGCRLLPDLEGVPAPEEPAAWPLGHGLLVAPGRVFDTEGGRVGRGLGYYDRFLREARSHVAVAGAAYDCQVVERVPREPHDVGIEWLVTETGLRRFTNR